MTASTNTEALLRAEIEKLAAENKKLVAAAAASHHKRTMREELEQKDKRIADLERQLKAKASQQHHPPRHTTDYSGRDQSALVHYVAAGGFIHAVRVNNNVKSVQWNLPAAYAL